MQPNSQNETDCHENLSGHRTTERLRDDQDRDKPFRGIEHVPRNSNQTSGTADLEFGLQLLLASSAVSTRGASIRQRPAGGVERNRLGNSPPATRTTTSLQSQDDKMSIYDSAEMSQAATSVRAQSRSAWVPTTTSESFCSRQRSPPTHHRDYQAQDETVQVQ